MNQAEYQAHDAVGLAELVATRQVSPGELLDAALARVEAVNPTLNAIVVDCAAQARAAIAEGLSQGPFTGVPYLLKDITTQMAGVPTSAGARLFANSVPAKDSALVSAYRRAGLVIFGKTNTPELGLVGITEPALFGPTLNPWNLERTCGGSSGGSASAVAGGIVPAAQASDGGGSIRIPASCCGLFGMKPSRGRVSMAPAGEGWAGFTVLHALTRSVRDSAALLDVSCLPEAGDPYALAPPEVEFAREARCDPHPLRIGMLTTNIYGNAMEAPCTAAVREAGRLCEGLGHHIDEVAAPAGIAALGPAVMAIVCASVVLSVDGETKRRGRALAEDEIEPLTRLLYEKGKTLSAVDYVRGSQTVHGLGRQIADWFAPYDVVLLSTLGALPLPVGMLQGPLGDLDAVVAKFYEFGPNTQIFNATGQPSMSVPLAWSEEGLPIGVQFAGPAGGEALLFRLAGQLERAAPWARRHPPEIGPS